MTGRRLTIRSTRAGPVNERAVLDYGRFHVFTGNSVVATRVRVASQDGKSDLTPAEVKHIVASVGLVESMGQTLLNLDNDTSHWCSLVGSNEILSPAFS